MSFDRIDSVGAADRTRVMVVLDPTRPAMPTSGVGVALGRRAGGLVEFVSVTSPGLPPKVVESFLESEARRYTDVAVERTRLEDESVVAALLAHISTTTPDIVVLSSHGRGPVGETLLGSVSADLVRSSSSPTLLVGPACEPVSVVSDLVVAVDGSDEAHDALALALALAPRLGIPLRLVEVATEPVTGPAFDLDDVAESAELRRIAASCDPPVQAWDVLHGHDVAAALIDHIEFLDGPILALGTHGRSPGRPRVLGGVAGRTVRRSPVPVLTVSPEARPRIVEAEQTPVRQPMR